MLGFGSGVIFILFNIFLSQEFVKTFSAPADSYNVNDFVIVDTINKGIWMLAFFEWLTLFGMLIWIFAFSIYCLNHAKMKE